ncbi:hypothetical protein D3H55_09570, partial [Bacillus salacetis]
ESESQANSDRNQTKSKKESESRANSDRNQTKTKKESESRSNSDRNQTKMTKKSESRFRSKTKIQTPRNAVQIRPPPPLLIPYLECIVS